MLYCLDNNNGNLFSDVTIIPYLSINKPIFETLTPLEIYQGAPKLLSILKSGPAIMIPPNIVISL